MREQLTLSIDRLETRDLLAVTGPVSPGVPIENFPPSENGTTQLQVSLTTNQTTYTPGQAVQMKFTETNSTGHDVAVNMGPSIDYFVITSGGRTIWRSNPGTAAQFIVHRVLQPGQSIVLTAEWTVPSATGTFKIHNQMAPQAAVATFKVVAHPTGPTKPTQVA